MSGVDEQPRGQYKIAGGMAARAGIGWSVAGIDPAGYEQTPAPGSCNRARVDQRPARCVFEPGMPPVRSRKKLPRKSSTNASGSASANISKGPHQRERDRPDEQQRDSRHQLRALSNDFFAPPARKARPQPRQAGNRARMSCTASAPVAAPTFMMSTHPAPTGAVPRQA